MEHNNSRLETIVGNLDQKFNKMDQKFNTLLKVMMKEKGLQDSEGEAPEPLLPTPPAHLRLMTPTELLGHQHETEVKCSYLICQDWSYLCFLLLNLGNG